MVSVMVDVPAGVSVDMVLLLFIFEFLEVAHDFASAERLAVAVVAKSEVLHPDALEGGQIFFGDGKHLLVEDPVHDVGARGVGQAALVVVEPVLGVAHILDRGILLLAECLEQLVEGYLVYLAKVLWPELLNEGMRVVAYLEEEPDDSEGLLVVLLLGAVHELVHDVDLEVVLLSIEPMLCGAMHVHVVHLVGVRALTVEVCDFDTTQVCALELYNDYQF